MYDFTIDLIYAIQRYINMIKRDFELCIIVRSIDLAVLVWEIKGIERFDIRRLIDLICSLYQNKIVF